MLCWRNTTRDLSLLLSGKIDAMLPSSCIHIIDELPINLVSDHQSTEAAVHRQPHNLHILEPMHTRVREALTSSEDPQSLTDATGEIVQKALADWLMGEQGVLAALAALFSLSSGPTFRSFQFCALQYDSSPKLNGMLRNLYFLDDGRPIFANPPAKQLGATIAPTALSFPPLAIRHICFYFWILRPVAIEILEKAGMKVPEYAWRIWVNPNPNTKRKLDPYAWTGCDFNKKIEELTCVQLGFRLTCPIIRQISHAVLRDKVPSLFNSAATTATGIVTTINDGPLRHLADTMNIPSFIGMGQKECFGTLLVSEVWQAVLGIGEANPALESLLNDAGIFPTLSYRAATFHHARAAIQRFYGIPHSDPTGCLASDILERKPFLPSDSVCPDPCLSPSKPSNWALITDTRMCWLRR